MASASVAMNAGSWAMLEMTMRKSWGQVLLLECQNTRPDPATLVKRAGLARVERYNRWYPLLQEEIDLVAPNAKIITVGKVVSTYLKQQGFPRDCVSIIHYSGQAASARNAGIARKQDSFYAFEESVSLNDVVSTAKEVFRASNVPEDICKDGLTRLKQSELTRSRKKLMFNYKLAFESMRS